MVFSVFLKFSWARVWFAVYHDPPGCPSRTGMRLLADLQRKQKVPQGSPCRDMLLAWDFWSLRCLWSPVASERPGRS